MRKEELWAIERIVDEENDWRHLPQNAFTRDGKAVVSIISTENRELKEAIGLAVDKIGGLNKVLAPGDRVLLKANFNSDDPPPAITDPAFLTAVVELMREQGIDNLTLGERSGWPWMPTARVLKEMGIFTTAESLDLPVIDFDQGPWMDVRLGREAKYWDKIAYHKSLKEFDKIVFLPCMKHHFLARFTMSIKLTVGLTHPKDMIHLHADRHMGKTDEPMELKMPEMALPVTPDLIIMDGRKAFVTDGPANGELVKP
ncbi:MAG: DUF362 domain-containing protein, partial [Deltaproteobacteria bacterium]|nr:DUF362 domain-containing protein [Deltaproteobacteria bacterium]